MYKIKIEIETEENDTTVKKWVNLLGKTLTDTVINPSVELALNKAGRAEFTVPASHPYYSDIHPMKTNVEIFETGVNHSTGEMFSKSIFFGRVSSINIDWYNQKRVTCEGALAFFNDSIQRFKRYSAHDPGDKSKLINFFKNVLDRHNDQMTDDSRKILFGEMDVRDAEDKTKQINEKKVFRLTNYETTLEVLSTQCIESEGGYFTLDRPNEDEDERETTINWYSEFDEHGIGHAVTPPNQPAKFALNLLDLNQDFEPEELYTALLPLGADVDIYDWVTNIDGRNPAEQGWYCPTDNGYEQTSDTEAQPGKNYYVKSSKPLTIKTGSRPDYIEDENAVAEYGFILKTKKWDDISDKEKLYNKATKWLKSERFDKFNIQCDVADLSPLDSNWDSLNIGDIVNVVSAPHGLNINLPISEIRYDLNNGKKNVTIGTREQVTLSRITKDGTAKEVRIPDARYDYGSTDD